MLPYIKIPYKVTVIKQLKLNSMHLVVIKTVLKEMNKLTNEKEQEIET